MTTLPRFTYYACILQTAFCMCAYAQTTAFSYQGQLADNGSPANGLYDLRFELYDADTLGTSIGVVTNAATEVSDGLFTVTLDYGSGLFDGSDRWLEIGAVTNGGGSFTVLSPRQRITSTPYAVRAGSFSGPVEAAQLTGTIAPANIAAGTITGEMLATGTVTSAQLATGAVTGEKLASHSVDLSKLGTEFDVTFSQTITNPAPAADERFGFAITALGNDRYAIGAYQDGVIDSGSVYVYSLDGVLLTNIPNPAPDSDAWFGYSLATLDDDQFLVGARGADLGGSVSAGGAFLLTGDGTLLTTFTNPTPASAEFFGHAVAAVGDDKVLISAIGDGAGAANAGAAYLFTSSGALLTTFTNPTPASADFFGWSATAVGNDKALVGAYVDDTGAENAGAAYLFDLAGNLLTTFTNPFPATFDYFGASVAPVGSDKVLIGAYAADVAVTDAGAAYLFALDGTLLKTFTSPTPTGIDNFGNWVLALGEDKVVIGDSGDNFAFTGGAAYIYALDGSLLLTLTNATPAGLDGFAGTGATVGRDVLLVGASQDNAGASGAGAAHLYSINNYFPGLQADGALDGSISTAALTDESVTTEKLADGSVTSADIDTESFSTTFWRASGNAATTAGMHFLGTTDTQPLEIKVNNVRGLRLEYPTVGIAPNLIGGHSDNDIGSGTQGAVISGGVGNDIGTNAGYSAIGGGWDNAIGSSSFYSVIAGGLDNEVGASSAYAFAAGRRAKANHAGTFVWADSTDADFSTTGEKQFLIRATGGVGINKDSPATTLDVNGTVTATSFAGDGSGLTGLAIPDGHSLDAADGSPADRVFVNIAGLVGIGTTTPSSAKAVTLQGVGASSGWIQFRTTAGVDEWHLAFEGGGLNFVETDVAADRLFLENGGYVGIGTASPDGPLDIQNAVKIQIDDVGTANQSQRIFFDEASANDNHGFSLVNAGSANPSFEGTTMALPQNTFAILRHENSGSGTAALVIQRGTGNVGIGTDSPTERLHVIGNILATGTITPSSDRNLKKNLNPVNPQEVLARVASLPIQQWTYKAEKDSVRHVGPMAQDFHAAFGLGVNDTTIATVDADGVALAAIQGLNQKLEQKDARIAKMERELLELKQLVSTIMNEGNR